MEPTREALAFVDGLERRFGERRRELLAARRVRQAELDAGVKPQFLERTKKVRESDWRVAAVPADLQDRRVEITGPVDRKMVINALNSGAKAFMADFEDSHSPTWEGTLQGQVNLQDAIRGTIEYRSPEGKVYKLGPKPAVLIVRPRGWHLVERHHRVGSEPVSASLFDFGLFFFNNARELLARGTGPYFYLPKLESHLEARLWNDVFVHAQKELDLPVGTIKATVLIETILAAFEMDEILYELRDHCVGLNCGRWDYIFSYIKKFRRDPARVLPDRAQVTMTVPFLKAYSHLLIQTCHRRGAHAMGGMAAQIPIKSDAAANDAAIAKVRADKLREVKAGHDGTWVAHPGLVPVAMEVFDQGMPGPNQVHELHPEYRVRAEDLIAVPEGTVTQAGLQMNVNVSIRYLEAWLRGQGCVPLHHLMEDAATAEISRAQLWQWARHGAKLADGGHVSVQGVLAAIDAELARLGTSGKTVLAGEILKKIIQQEDFEEFLTLPAYDLLTD